ncbi:MAG: dihydrofolate synthase [Bacteroidetes bacterium 4572_128]|nr:MAG: dihydrofolate synthase [Bacteroidetes bacterium 4572_128]
MTYKESIDFLFEKFGFFQKQGKKAYKGSLENAFLLDNYLKFPHKNFKTIHVAGTNGKGSVSHFLSAVLQKANYKVGLYTSPHLKDFRERIKINGNFIPKKEVINFVSKNKEIILKIKPSFFEITVFMAFEYFSREKVDFAIIEVGLGGRLDTTNIISPILSIITNISLDHTNILGNSLEKIAYEKAGIIKNNPIIIGETQNEIKEIFIKKAKEKKADIFFADEIYNAHYSLFYEEKQSFNFYKNENIFYENLRTDLKAFYQKKNLITSLASLDILKKFCKITRKNIYNGISNVVETTGFLGRWQIIGNNPLIICDTAHNLSGIKEVLKQIENTAYKNLHFIFGVLKDKNIDEILNILPKNAYYYFTKAKISRALDEKILQKKAENFNLNGKTFNKVTEALKNAKKISDENDLIFIGGSTFIVAEIV